LANLVINFSVSAFLLAAFSTISNILETVDSPNFLVTFTFNKPLVFIPPDNISSLGTIFLGTDSPVSAEVSIKLSPSITTPSKGTFSPGLTKITSSTFTVSGDTFFSFPFIIIFA